MNRKRLGLVLVAVVLLIVLIVTLPAVFQKFPGGGQAPRGKIVYQSNPGGNMDIYLLDLATGQPVRLTNDPAPDYSAAYISALERISFVSDRQEGTNVYTMNLDGSQQQAVFSQSLLIDYPDWSPEGNVIAASYSDPCLENQPCNFDLYIFEIAESMKTQLTNTIASEWVPQWSPDGRKIAFASDRDGDSEIYVMEMADYSVTQLTSNLGYDGRPRWSPDGSVISFESDRDGGDWDIFVMKADGSHPRLVTASSAANDWMQFWSPDGKWLVFVSDMDGDTELYIIDLNGENLQQLTVNDFADEAPVWIP